MSKGERTRRRMVDAAATLMKRRGYYGTGLKQVLVDSESPKGSLYFHFPGGKEELAAEAVRSAGAAWRSSLLEAMKGQETFADGARAACQRLAEVLVQSDFNDGCPVATVALEVAPTSQLLHEACVEIYGGWQVFIEQRLRSLGVPEARTASVATALLAMLEGAVLLCKAHRSIEPLERVGDELARLCADFE